MIIATNANTYPLFNELLNALENKDVARVKEVSAKIRYATFADTYEFNFCLAHFVADYKFVNDMARLNFCAWCGVRYQWDALSNGMITYISTCKKDGTVFAIVTTTKEAQVKEISIWDKTTFRKEWEEHIRVCAYYTTK